MCNISHKMFYCLFGDKRWYDGSDGKPSFESEDRQKGEFNFWVNLSCLGQNVKAGLSFVQINTN